MSGNEAHDEQINDLESQVVKLKEYIHDLEKRAVHEQQLEIEVAKLKERLYKIIGDESCGTFASYEQLFDEVAKLKEELKSKQMENTLLINNVYDLQYKESGMETKIEQLKSTLDEIKSPEFLEELASIEHEQWIEWATSLMSSEKLSSDRMIRWAILMVKYDSLTDGEKEQDRKYARLILKAIDKHGEIKCVI